MIAVEVLGVEETLRAVRSLGADLRKGANAEIRAAAKQTAAGLVVELQASARSSGVPLAPRVAATAKVKSDRFPTVVIGGSKAVGRYGAPASAVIWGTEHGPASDPNRFAVDANSGGYWIAPAVEKFRRGPAIRLFQGAIEATLRRYGL